METNGLSASSSMSVNVQSPLSGTTTNLSSSVDSAKFAAPVTLTATVVANSGTTIPTGMFTFLSNGITLGVVPVSGTGNAIFTTTALPGGSNLIQATYNGDATYAGSSSNVDTVAVDLPVAAAPAFSLASGTYTSAQILTITDATAGVAIYYTTDGSLPTDKSVLYTKPISITTSQTIQAIALASGYTNSPVTSATYVVQQSAPLDFSLSNAGASSQQISAGGAAHFDLLLSPTNTAYPGVITFTVSGLPSGATFSLSPNSVSEVDGPTHIYLTIQTVSEMAAKAYKNDAVVAFVLLLPFFGIRLRTREKMSGGMTYTFLLIFPLLLLAGLSGCSSKVSPAPAGKTYAITVTATSGTLQHAAVVNLEVN